jgi:hypothetical protein
VKITVKEGSFFCARCDSKLTIHGADNGKGFYTRCKTCKENYYYPSCSECAQPTWNHDDDKHKSIVALKKGRRYCRRCKKEKATSEFSTSVNNRLCKACQAKYFKEWYNKQKPKENQVVDDSVLDELFGDM